MSFDLVSILTWLVSAAATCGVFFFIWRHIKNMGQGGGGVVKPSVEKPLRSIGKKGGLHSDILKEGSGPGAKARDTLTVDYVAFLQDGKKVDSSYDRGRKMTFKLGVGAVILGWDQALLGIKAGEKRKVSVPAALAYGGKGQNKVPPNSTIIFEIEVHSIE